MELPNTKALYQDSGALWLGSIPERWQLKKLKFLVSCVGGGTPNTGKPEFWAGDIPWVSPKDMKRAVIDSTEDYLTELGVRSSATALISAGAVLIVVRSGILRHSIPVALNSVEVSLNQDMKALIPNGDLSSSLLYWIIEGNQSQLLPLWSKPGCTVESIELTYLLNTEIPVPSDEEQQAITRFLDYKTTQIDALIAKKQALLEKLAEKRTALISHAVTKGLDPSAPMKDSGVAWLGEIPSHWKLTPFKWCCRITEGQVDPKNELLSSLPLIAPNHIESGTGRLLKTESAEEQGAISGKYFYKQGALLYSKIRPALVKACIANLDGLCSADMYPIYPQSGLLSEFLLYQILSKGFTQFALLVSERVAMPKVNRESLGDFKISIPPEQEQEQIVGFIRSSVEKIDRQERRSIEAIDKLKEYRSALITNAVTGKIDVRDFKIPQSAKEPAHA